jgi:hypothetical protein
VRARQNQAKTQNPKPNISGCHLPYEYINHKISFRGASFFPLFFALLIVILDIFVGIETNKIGVDYVDFCLVY